MPNAPRPKGRGLVTAQPTNAPREPAGAESFRWPGVPHWYLWEGGFLLIGSGQGVVPPHAHHAIQIVMAMDGRVAIRGQDDPWRDGSDVVVQPDVVHSFDAQGAWAAMLFVDPESTEGIWLRSSLAQDITVVPEAALKSPVSALRTFAERPLEGMDVGALIRSLRAGAEPRCPARSADGSPGVKRAAPNPGGR